MHRSNRPTLSSLLILCSIYIGCAHIPKQSVELSEELTKMIVSAQAAHLAMIDEYLLERQSRVDTFLNQTWTPDFIKEFVKSSGVMKDLENANTFEEKGRIMMQFSKAAAKEISVRRTALIGALDKIGDTLKSAIRNHYTDMLMVNQALTAHLRSAAKVTETREKLLNQMEIKPEIVLPMDKINNSIEKIINYRDKVEDLVEVIEEVNASIKGGKK